MSEVSIASMRRRAKKVGLRFYKSNWRRDSIDNYGQYQVSEGNIVIYGDRYDADLATVEHAISLRETA